MPTTYEQIILRDGPKLFLPLNDTSGTTATALAGSNGTYSGSPTLGVAGPTPVGSTAAQFSGSGQYGTVPDADSLSSHAGATGVQTVEIWVNTALAAGGNRGILGKGSGSVFEFIATVNADNKIQFDFPQSNGASGMGVLSSVPLVQNAWTHVVAVYERAVPRLTLYQNGVQVAQSTSATGSTTNTATSLYFGTRNDGTPGSGTYDWNGKQAALAIYDYALSAAQIAQHYAASPLAFRGLDEAHAESLGAVLHLPLDDKGGTTAFARVGSNGTYSGGPTLRAAGPSTHLPYGIATDGTNDYVDVGTISLGASQAQTIEFWLNNSAVIDAALAFKRVFGSTTGNEWTITFGSVTGSFADEVVTVVDSKSAASRMNTWRSPLSIPAGWHHYALAYSGVQGGWALYIDGLDATSAAWGAVMSLNASGAMGMGADAYRLAAYTPSSQFSAFAGLAGFGVYNRRLTPAKVYERYTIGLNGPRVVHAQAPVRF